ncbi:hypothetical protein FISHEDRAFT_62927 [Fistulina hepatica ATCC 64428]|uniref:PH-domain-containing protein n=1 Tax=Fistulina hepatica ATCC 64428 TaxID=1128425 RepID=A0A0D7A058_9AGAR|nr:hypothetical protein FISHEDRAFT_62927 [Fistulina hepatica ATCC 64428]
MVEYVYALHDFDPENDDEVPFLAGERIEVIEKDDEYQDGWWKVRRWSPKRGLELTATIQGRNLSGKVGLFPQSYTAAASSEPIVEESQSLKHTTLQPLTEESGPESTRATTSPKTDTHPEDGVMKATMTDIQKAIEQLGSPRDDGRSFSFTSSRDDTDDTGSVVSDGDEYGSHNGNWHKDARQKLAEKARKAVEEAEKLEKMMGSNRMAPPINAELSEESDEEEENVEYTSSSFRPRYSYIPEEEEEPSEHEPRDESIRDESELPTASAAQTSFTVQRPESPAPSASTSHRASTIAPSTATSVAPPVANDILPNQLIGESPIALPAPATASFGASHSRNNSYSQPRTVSLSQPGSLGRQSASSVLVSSKHSSVASVVSSHPAAQPRTSTSPSLPPQPSPPPVQYAQPPLSAASSLQPTLVEEPTTKASESSFENKPVGAWSVEDVVAWLASKGFSSDICEKFIEQEITGDVLIELDTQILKDEIGIMAFGKRVRIANAVAELRRPLSFSFPPPAAATAARSSSITSSEQISSVGMHSRVQSQTQSHVSYAPSSHHSYVGGGPPLSPAGSYPASGYGSPLQQVVYDARDGRPASPASEPAGGSVNGHAVSVPAAAVTNGSGTARGLGIDMAERGYQKPRPANLNLVPPTSDVRIVGDEAESQRRVFGLAVSKSEAIPTNVSDVNIDKGALSDTETQRPKTAGGVRRLFGRGHEAASISRQASYERRSKESARAADKGDKHSTKEAADARSTMSAGDAKSDTKSLKEDSRSTISVGDVFRVHNRGRKSVDHNTDRSVRSGKAADRLSILGGTMRPFSSKGRKPPPQYPASEDEGTSKPPHSAFLKSGRKTSSGRPSSSAGESTSEKKDSKRSPKQLREYDAVLRKRTLSSPNVPSPISPTSPTGESIKPPASASTNVDLKGGQSVLDQIGEPDYAGFMRKRGEKYGTWKMRYFVLKGQYLYWMKSNSKSETKYKGCICIIGYRVTSDENLNPGRYGFRIDHDSEKSHYFSDDDSTVIREWMKAIMKATIARDYARPVVSSANVHTIPLMVAQAMNPSPRPPSPTARAATQRAMRRGNPNQLSSRDARVLMGIPDGDGPSERARFEASLNKDLQSPNGNGGDVRSPKSPAPPRPSREMRRNTLELSKTAEPPLESELFLWANIHLPVPLRIKDPSAPLGGGGLMLMRIAESVKGQVDTPPVPDSAFPRDPMDDRLDGLFKLFDFMLDNDVKMGSVSINDVKQGRRDKIVQIMRALKAWDDKQQGAVAPTLGAPAKHAL